MAKKRRAVVVREAPISELGELGSISIAFEVSRILDVSSPDEGLGGLVLNEIPVAEPYVIDHDAREGEGPSRWSKRFDLSNWGLLFAEIDGARVGGAVIAFDTPNLFMLEGRRDIAALWDLRVQPEFRGMDVGRSLVKAAEAWANERGCRVLKIETQNVNVTACGFYVRQGYTLRSIDDAPDEAQLILVKTLEGS
jgi:GNAT superfamily N-acetyltransferase